MVRNIKIENLFAIIALLFGLFYVFLLPPFQSVDEAAHFYRGYEIASNKPFAKKYNNEVGDYLPSSLSNLALKYSFLIKNVDNKVNINYIKNSAKIKINKNDKKFIQFSNTALYSPICYITQLPGTCLANIFNANPLIIFYRGRISNLIFFIILGYLSLRIIPFYKMPLALLLLMPMTLSLASSLTSDVIVIGFNFLWFSLLLKILNEEKLIGYRKILTLFLIASIISLAKSYFLLIPLIFILPKDKFKSTWQYLACIIGVLIISITSVLIWQNIINTFGFNMNGSANSSKQLEFILSNPIEYCFILLKTFILKFGRIIITMVGVLGWQDTRLDFLTYILYPIMIALSVFIQNTDFYLKKWQKNIIFVDIVFSIFLIFTTLYLMWDRVGSNIIMGLNGKYFIPLVLPLLFLFKNKFKLTANNQKNIGIILFVFVILMLFSSDLSLINRFYELTPNLYYKI